MGSVRRRVSLAGVSALIAVAGIGITSVGVTSSGAASGTATTVPPVLPVVTVAPSKGLVDLQKVTVTGTGFSANVEVGTVECRPGALAEPDCDLNTLVYAQTDQHGAVTLSRYVRRLIVVSGKKVDCGAAKGCILGAGNVANLKQANGQTIFFNPKIPAKVASVTVSPNTNLVDHQLVTVSGKGFAPSTSAYISECLVHGPPGFRGQACDYATQRFVTVSSNGTFTAANFVLERRQAFFTRNATQRLDCAAKAGTCDITVNAGGLGSAVPATAPLTFNAKVKPVVAGVQISPSSSLQDLQSVTLTGTGFTPGFQVSAQECSAATPPPPETVLSTCDYTTVRSVTADFHGNFTLTYAVRRDIAAFVGPATTGIDCGAKAGTCLLAIQGSPSQPTTTLPLTFDPNAPAVAPTMTANPGTGLTDNETVTVSMQGFTPNQPVQIVECAAEAVADGPNLSYCDYTTGVTATPIGTSSLQTSFVVRSVLGGQSGLVDCTAQPGACVLVASESGGGYFGGGIAVPTAGPSALPNIASTPLTFTPVM